MGITFIYSAAGSGKSTALYKKIVDQSVRYPKKHFLLIVPDQFTMQTQKDIVKMHPSGGIMNIDVLSFGRLSYRVFEEVGRPRQLVLDDTGKSLMLRKIAQELEPQMPFIGSNLKRTGYIHEVKSSLSEFMQYGIGEQELENIVNGTSKGLLQFKLQDLLLIYRTFNHYKEGKFITSEETLDLLCKALPQSVMLQNSVVAFDGFTGFTPIQERVIRTMMKLAEDVYMTVTLSKPEQPDEKGGEQKLFYLSRRTVERIRRIAEEEGMEQHAFINMDETEFGRFSHSEEFAHLEHNLFRSPYAKYSKQNEKIEIFATDRISDEVDEICTRIKELIRDEGFRYCDFAIVTGNLDAYAGLFETKMAEAAIPCYIDQTHSIVLNPFIEFMKSALLIIQKDFSYESVMHYLRCGFVDFKQDEVDRFENYILSLGIRGKSRFTKPFTRKQKGLPDDKAIMEVTEREEFRIRMMNGLHNIIQPSKTVTDYVKNLYDFLTCNRSCEKLQLMEQHFTDTNELSLAREYGQIYRLVMELLEQINSLIGNEIITIEEFIEIFEAGIFEIEVGTIPQNVDRVTVGDIERSRLREVKVLLFAGLNDCNIPKSSSNNGILSAMERETLVESGITLAPAPREQMYTQRLYLYMNLLKPTSHLILSYSGTGSDGKSMRPAYLIDVLLRMYPNLHINKIDKSKATGRMISLDGSFDFFANKIREYAERGDTAPANHTKADPSWKALSSILEALLTLYKANNKNKEAMLLIQAAFKQYQGEPISGQIARAIYGDEIHTSISRMEKYALCAYSHFLRYGMELKERELFEFETVDLGTVYHGVLELFSEKLTDAKLSWFTFDQEQGEQLVSEAVKQYCEAYGDNILLDNERAAYSIRKIERIMQRAVDTLAFQLRRGLFHPVAFEAPFEKEVIPENGNPIHIHGKIDRIDICEEDNKVYVKIIDFKSGVKKLNITDIYYGLQLQLAVYMESAMEKQRKIHPDSTIVPSAMLYYHVEDPLIELSENTSDEGITALVRKELKMNGIVNEDVESINRLDQNIESEVPIIPVEFNKNGSLSAKSSTQPEENMNHLFSYVNHIVQKIATNVVSGDIRVNPYLGSNKDACEYCDYSGICGYDEKIPGYCKREPISLDKDHIESIVLGGAEDGSDIFD